MYTVGIGIGGHGAARCTLRRTCQTGLGSVEIRERFRAAGHDATTAYRVPRTATVILPFASIVRILFRAPRLFSLFSLAPPSAPPYTYTYTYTYSIPTYLMPVRVSYTYTRILIATGRYTVLLAVSHYYKAAMYISRLYTYT